MQQKITCSHSEIEIMFKYFDVLFVRIYNQYIRWNERDIPKLYSILILSLFQSMNVLAIYFLVRSLFEKDVWVFPKLYVPIIMILIVIIDYIRIFKIIGFNKLVQRYEEPSKRKLVLHPVFYFIISIAILVFLRFLNLFPHIS